MLGNICVTWLCRLTGSSHSEAEPTWLCICPGVSELAGGSPTLRSLLNVTKMQAEPKDLESA